MAKRGGDRSGPQGSDAADDVGAFRSAPFETLPTPVVVVDADSRRVCELNSAALDLFDSDRDSLLGRPLEELCLGSDDCRGLVDRALEGRTPHEGLYVDSDDGAVPVEATASSVTVDGETYVQVAVRDVGGRYRRERVLEELHAGSRRLMGADSREAVCRVVGDVADEVLDLPVHGVMLYDPDRDVLDPVAISDPASEEFGAVGALERGEGVVWKAFERGEAVVYGDVREDPDVYDPETAVRSEFVVPIGEYGVFLASSTAVDDFEESDVSLGRVLAANAEAALSRLDREREVSERTRRLRTIVENAPIVLFGLDEEGRFTLSRGRGLDGLGLDSGELVGESVFEVFASHEGVVENCRRALDGEAFESVNEVDGHVFETWYRPVDGTVGPPGTAATAVIGFAIEVTERERNERLVRVLNRFLRHNLRNAMDVVVGYAERLDDHPDPYVRALVEEVAQTGDELTRLSEKARRVSRTVAEEHTGAVDLRESLEGIAADVEVAFDAAIELDGPDDATSVDRRALVAFEEVVENAAKHPDPPEVSVAVSEGPGGVVVAVADDGPGIPEQERLVLESDETPLRHGSGLGLFVADWAVTDVGGELTVEDTGAGTVVRIQVPTVEE